MTTQTGMYGFIRTARDNGFQDIRVRGQREARRFRATFGGCDIRELRTRKHTYAVVAFDELGNATILTSRGEVRQLVGGEADALPR